MSNEEPRSLPPELQAWLDREDPEERGELERVWHLLENSRLPAAASPDAEKMWAAVEPHLDTRDAHRPSSASRREETRQAAERQAVRRSRPLHTRLRWAGAAAAVVIAVLGGLWLWRQPVHVSAPPGGERIVSLPDGSSVELSSGTTLSYRRGFKALPLLSGRHRRVRLQGEGFFDVTERARPFVVETFNARVEVLGTRFNVRAWPEASERATQATLASGRVQVVASAGKVTLEKAGQFSRVVGTASVPTAPHDTSMRRVLAWRRQGFSVSNRSLAFIFNELERRYGARITVKGRERLTDIMTLFYPQQTDLETILHDVCVAKGLQYRATSQGYEVFEKSPVVAK